eukprot:s4468_g2.t1
MAIGCLSPRTVFWRAERFERENGKDQDRLWDMQCAEVYFSAVLARLFSLLLCPLRADGVLPFRTSKALEAVEAECRSGAEVEGGQERPSNVRRTGVPLVDALMRELSETGFMANRGRYIVASYLVFYLNIDWRVGADWFESLLLDHDVCSNYGEWASMANVAEKYPLGLKGRGPTGGRKPGAKGGGGDPWAKGVDLGDAIFDPFEQARHYDRDESYVRRWLPELSALPAGSRRLQRSGRLTRGNTAILQLPAIRRSGRIRVTVLNDAGKRKHPGSSAHERIPAVAEYVTSLFSQLLPGTRLRSHCGPSNLRLTCHLGIRIPSGCKIVCGGEPRCWEEGKCIVFDDSFEHEVLHEGDEARTVLLVNFWHPDVPPEMRQGLMTAARSPHDPA